MTIKTTQQTILPIQPQSQSTNIQEAILELLSKSVGPVPTLQIAKFCGKQTTKEVNPDLYDLQGKGRVVRVNQSPPTWSIRFG